MIVRSFGNNGQFTVNDYTEEVNQVPNTWGTLNSLNIFTDVPVATHSVEFEEVIKDFATLTDSPRGVRSKQNQDYQKKIHTFQVPHFPFDDAIYPNDLVGQRAYGQANQMETLDLVRARRLERIRWTHAITLEVARAHVITTGTVYAPNGTVSLDWYQEMTQAARPTAIDFVLGDPTTKVSTKIEQCIVSIQDNSGQVSLGSGIIALCGPGFFSKLISHAEVKEAYKFYASTQEPNRQRLAASGSGTVLQRRFFYHGVTFIEMRDAFKGVPLIPTNDAYFLPTGTEYFKTYFSPANRFGLVGTMGEQVYVFEEMKSDKEYTIETESNHTSALLKPLLVCKAFTAP